MIPDLIRKSLKTYFEVAGPPVKRGPPNRRAPGLDVARLQLPKVADATRR